MKSLKSRIKNTRGYELLKFLIKFLLLSLPIFFIVDWNLYPVQKFTAWIVKALLEFFNEEVVLFNTLSGGLMHVPALYFERTGLVVLIDPACSGIRSFYLLLALLFSSEEGVKKKFMYLLIGGVILLLVNIIRIFLVSLIAVNFSMSELFENVLWSGSLNITVFLIFYYFLKH